MKGHFVYQWVLKEMAFFAITLDSWEHFKATPASYSSVSWGFRQQSRRKGSWEFLLCDDKNHGKATKTQGHMGRQREKRRGASRFSLLPWPLVPQLPPKIGPRSGWLRRRCDLWILGLLVSLFTSILYIRCGYLHSFRCEWEKNNIPTICWSSSELNNKRSHVTNLPEGATQILLQTTCNHQILRTIFYFQSAQKWKWILQDH